MAKVRKSFIKEDFLFGVRYWKYVRQSSTPKYDVLKYIGRKGSRFWFERLKDKARIGLKLSELEASNFGPFLIDYKRVKPYYDGRKDSQTRLLTSEVEEDKMEKGKEKSKEEEEE